MAKGALVLTWGSPVRGREMKALEVFGESLTYYDSLAKAGQIHGIRTYLATTGDLSELGGMFVIDGELEQLRALQSEPEYQKITLKAENIVDHLTIHVMTGGSPDDIQEPMGVFTEVLGALGIS